MPQEIMSEDVLRTHWLGVLRSLPPLCPRRLSLSPSFRRPDSCRENAVSTMVLHPLRHTYSTVVGNAVLARFGSSWGAAEPPNRSVSSVRSFPASALSTRSATIDGTLRRLGHFGRVPKQTRNAPSGDSYVLGLDQSGDERSVRWSYGSLVFTT